MARLYYRTVLTRREFGLSGAAARETERVPPTAEALHSYLEDLNQVLGTVDAHELEAVADRLQAAAAADKALFVTGNGGSAATASHWVNDVLQPPSRVRATALCDSAASLAELADEHGVEDMFGERLARAIRPGDVLVVISVSGSSPNLVSAVRVAAGRGAATVGLLGWDGGRLRALCDDSVVVVAPRGEYGVVESAHAVICDVIARRLRIPVAV